LSNIFWSKNICRKNTSQIQAENIHRKYSLQIHTAKSPPSRAQAFNRSMFSINIIDRCFRSIFLKLSTIKGLLIAEIQTSLNGHVS